MESQSEIGHCSLFFLLQWTPRGVRETSGSTVWKSWGQHNHVEVRCYYLVTVMHIEFGLFCFHDHCSNPFQDIFTRLGLIYCGCDKLGYQLLLFICNRTMIWISPQMRCFHLEWKIIILLRWAYLSQCQVMLKNMQYDTLKILESE